MITGHGCFGAHGRRGISVWSVTISTRTFRIVCGTAFGSLCVIVLTGALVRLTGSGLGCADWPRCSETRFIDLSTAHARIEQLNRLFTGIVSLSVIGAVLLAHVRRPRRPDLVLLAWCLVGGVVAQIVIGGIVVLTGLNPFANMAHFLVSMVLVASAFLLYRRSADVTAGRWMRELPPASRLPVVATGVLSVVVLVTGTVVTATGPHAGDDVAARFEFALRDVARVHSGAVLVFVAVLLWALISTRRTRTDIGRVLGESLQAVVLVAMFQAGIGYLQYFTDVPVILVAGHIVGAVSLWVTVCAMVAAPPAAAPA